ncbi:MAG: hypothetical protein KAX15_02680 [Candidatus Omnitrophica bacterium]|nr:hypothetical protein [Candidatus Omnitrophota bacterium]
MSFTKNYNLPEMPSGPVEWPAIFNTLINAVEAGRTIKITAAEALTAGQPVQPPASTGKVSKAANDDPFLGIVQADIALDAEGFVYAGVGNEITVGSGWTIGGLIYVSTTAGALTQTKPTPEAVAIAYANTATSIVLLRPVIDDRSLPVSHHFMQEDVAASQSAVAIPVLGLAGNTEIVMPKAGSITGISIASNEARTAGTLTVDITVNGTVTGLQAVLDGTNTQYHYETQARRTDTFSAGDRIGVKITTDAAWLPITADIVVMVLTEI